MHVCRPNAWMQNLIELVDQSILVLIILPVHSDWSITLHRLMKLYLLPEPITRKCSGKHYEKLLWPVFFRIRKSFAGRDRIYGKIRIYINLLCSDITAVNRFSKEQLFCKNLQVYMPLIKKNFVAGVFLRNSRNFSEI